MQGRRSLKEPLTPFIDNINRINRARPKTVTFPIFKPSIDSFEGDKELNTMVNTNNSHHSNRAGGSNNSRRGDNEPPRFRNQQEALGYVAEQRRLLEAIENEARQRGNGGNNNDDRENNNHGRREAFPHIDEVARRRIIEEWMEENQRRNERREREDDDGINWGHEDEYDQHDMPRQKELAIPQVNQFSSPLVLSRAAKNYELKSSTANSLPTFHGLSNEDPLGFIREYYAVVEEIPARGLTLDDMKMKCFSSSLKDKAKSWFLSLEPGSLNTWSKVYAKFVNQYYSAHTTGELRREIATFEQRDGELFHEAWERYKGLLTACPHHNNTQTLVMQYFFDGLLPHFKQQVEAQAKDDFGDLNARQAQDAFEKLSEKSRQTNTRARKVKVNEVTLATKSKEEKQVEDLKKQVEELKYQIKRDTPPQQSIVNCKRCGGTGHIADVCQAVFEVTQEDVNVI